MWIELHQTLPRHPKLARLANRLRIPRAQAAGHLTFLWLWALDYAPSGNVSALEHAEISAAADFGGDAELFAKALRECGWIDEDGRIHDWDDYAGRIVHEREKSRSRMREFRNKERALRERAPNVRVTNTERAELPNLTVPNLTRPDIAIHPAREGSWPSLADAVAAAELAGVPKAAAEEFWHHFEGQGWVTKDGIPIANWRAKLKAWWTSQQSRQAEQLARPRNGQRAPLPKTPSDEGF